MNNTIARAFLSADHVLRLFSDDETVNDCEQYFDTYAFQIWNHQQHNENDVALEHLIWENYSTADVDATDPDDY